MTEYRIVRQGSGVDARFKVQRKFFWWWRDDADSCCGILLFSDLEGAREHIRHKKGRNNDSMLVVEIRIVV